ncbi:MAG TPA: hypothetical protein VD790_10355 [Thermoleophilaceae bacterium]|nr:hypothetical protein [Thermoleophilaceae bacterium]
MTRLSAPLCGLAVGGLLALSAAPALAQKAGPDKCDSLAKRVQQGLVRWELASAERAKQKAKLAAAKDELANTQGKKARGKAKARVEKAKTKLSDAKAIQASAMINLENVREQLEDEGCPLAA